jgi:glycosyltransferase involved in cell wall biosynthesis
MRFLLAANFVRDMPWTPAWWAVTLARGLADRGHEVELVLDGTEVADPSAFGVPVHIARRDRIHLGAHPGRFHKLIAARRASTGATVLSLTPLAAGDLWLPVDPSPLQVARRLIRDLRPVSLALELSHHPWIGFEAWSAWRAGARSPAALTFGPGKGASDHVLPRVSTLSPQAAERARRDAASVRERLGITGTLATLSLPEVDPRIIGPYLGDLAASIAGRAMTILIATPRPHTVTRLATQAGLQGARAITLTRSMPSIVAGSDVVLAPPTQFPPPRGGQSGRWIADAIALGTPVIASASAPGAELLQTPESGACWASREELARALQAIPPRTDPRSRPAEIPARVALDRLLEKLESLATRDTRKQPATVPNP